MACEEQRGPLSQAHLQKNDDTFSANVGTSGLRRVDRLPSWKRGPQITERQKDGGAAVLAVSSEHTQGKDDLINRKNLERFSGSPVPYDLKCFTQAMRESTLMEKGERGTPHNEGTGTKPKENLHDPVPRKQLQVLPIPWDSHNRGRFFNIAGQLPGGLIVCGRRPRNITNYNTPGSDG